MASVPQYWTRGSCATLLSRRATSWSNELKFKPFVTTLQMAGKFNTSASSKHQFCSRMVSLIHQRDVKHLKVSASGGSSQNDKSESIVSKNLIKLSDVTHKAEESVKGSCMLFGDKPPKCNAPESKNQIGSRVQEGVNILKVIWEHLPGIIKRILKIPKAILLMWYFVISVLNGSEPTREQLPLWVLRTIKICLSIKLIFMLFGSMEQMMNQESINQLASAVVRFLSRSS